MKPSLMLAASLFLAPLCRAAAPAAPAKEPAAAKPAASGPTEAQIKKALEKNPNLILDVLRSHKKEFIQTWQEAYMEEKERAQREQEEMELNEAFKKPFKPELDAKAHVRGSAEAKYTLVEYSDFQCPYCGRGFMTVEALRKKYGADLRFIYKNKPLPMHPMAMPAAQYFEAAALQSVDKAYALHDKLFENQNSLSEDFIKKSAKEVGLDVDKLEKDSKSAEVKNKIEADSKEADSFEFTGTPGFLINGIPVRGAYPPERFDKIIERLNKKS